MKLLTLITHSMPQSQLFQQANTSPAFILTLTSCSVSSPPPSHAELLLQHDPWQANPQKWTWANWSKQPRSHTIAKSTFWDMDRYGEIRIFVQLHSLASGNPRIVSNWVHPEIQRNCHVWTSYAMKPDAIQQGPPFCAAMGDVFLKKKWVTPIHLGT